MVKLKAKPVIRFAVVEQSSTFRGLQSECCLFIKLKGKPRELLLLLWNKVRHLEGYKVN